MTLLLHEPCREGFESESHYSSAFHGEEAAEGQVFTWGISPQKPQPANTVYCNLLPNQVYTVQCNALFTCEICICVNVKVNINFNIVFMVMQTKWVQAHSLRLCLHHYWHNANFDANTQANVDANSAIHKPAVQRSGGRWDDPQRPFQPPAPFTA